MRVLLYGLGVLVAFSPMLLPHLDRANRSAVDLFFYERQEASLLAFALAIYAVWNRRDPLSRLDGLGGDSKLRFFAIVIGAVAGMLLVWSRVALAPDLYAFSLVLGFTAFCISRKSLAASRILALPLMIALLVLPMPSPAYNELVWAAQRLATVGATEILVFLGHDVLSGSTLIRLDEHDFWVIETCSGL